MALAIQTFSNNSGGSALFKALGHPLVPALAAKLYAELAQAGSIAIIDPYNFASQLEEFYPLSGFKLAGVYVQKLEELGQSRLGHSTQKLSALAQSQATHVLLCAFDSERLALQIAHLLPANAKVLSLDALRVPSALLSEPKNYLSPLNFATNFAFFRDAGGLHTRLVTANYWGAWPVQTFNQADPNRQGFLWLNLFDANGQTLQQWQEPLPPANGSIVLDSAAIRARFNLPEFCGQLYIHVVGAAGHDVVKYALDTYGDEPGTLSCTHDANAWPADFYAGLPAPANDEQAVLLWVQNSHPVPMPAGAISLNLMGHNETRPLNVPLPAFASHALNVQDLFPDARWPQQFEISAGKHVVRPRYEVIKNNGRRRIAHPNVERTDLTPDPQLAKLAPHLGKGFILPAPILPLAQFATELLPTPMARSQAHLPLKLAIYNAQGQAVAEHAFGNMSRQNCQKVDIDTLVNAQKLGSDFGHIEVTYDFSAGQDADGWLHAIVRTHHRQTQHAADTSFGSHIFNTIVTYKNEPQSYTGKPPGLSTRLFLRLGSNGADAFCHLIYPASTPWHAHSQTELQLFNAKGQMQAKRTLNIACSGSHFWRVSEQFSATELAQAGSDAYVIIRDVTCRLFGYHGLFSQNDAAFALDHMFGF